jgi:hypothetical protein
VILLPWLTDIIGVRSGQLAGFSFDPVRRRPAGIDEDGGRDGAQHQEACCRCRGDGISMDKGLIDDRG